MTHVTDQRSFRILFGLGVGVGSLGANGYSKQPASAPATHQALVKPIFPLASMCVLFPGAPRVEEALMEEGKPNFGAC